MQYTICRREVTVILSLAPLLVQSPTVDTYLTVRAQAYYLTKQIGTYSQDHTLRQQVVAHPGTTR